MRIAILGASGKLGRLTTQYLRKALPEAELVLSSRSVQEGKDWLVFDPFKDDWSVLGQVDVLVNCIGAIQQKDMKYKKVHVGLVQQLLAAYDQIGAPRIVQMSALGAHRQNPVPFLRTKGEADDILLARLRDIVVVRPSIVCTPNTMIAQKLRQLLATSRLTLGKTFVPKGFLDTQLQPVMPEDLGDLMVEAVQNRNRRGVILAVGPEAHTFRQLLEWMQEKRGHRTKFVEMPRSYLEGFVKHFMSVFFPSTINYDQFRLLFVDNVGDARPMAEWIGRKMEDSKEFWRSEGVEMAESEAINGVQLVEAEV